MNNWLVAALMTAGPPLFGSLISRMIWLAGLHCILRETEPADRSALLRAYAVCQPAAAPRPSQLLSRPLQTPHSARKVNEGATR